MPESKHTACLASIKVPYLSIVLLLTYCTYSPLRIINTPCLWPLHSCRTPEPHPQVWEPEALANTTTAANLHKHKLSPYTDMQLYGKVVATVVRGELTYMYGNLNKQPCGSLMKRAA